MKKTASLPQQLNFAEHDKENESPVKVIEPSVLTQLLHCDEPSPFMGQKLNKGDSFQSSTVQKNAGSAAVNLPIENNCQNLGTLLNSDQSAFKQPHVSCSDQKAIECFETPQALRRREQKLAEKTMTSNSSMQRLRTTVVRDSTQISDFEDRSPMLPLLSQK